jgi:hypothetical protein
MAGLPIAAPPAQQRAHQSLAVEPIALGPPRPAVHLDARRIDNVVLNAVPAQQPIQPEAVVTGLVARQHSNRGAQPSSHRAPAPGDEFEQRWAVPGFQRVPAQLVRDRRVDHNVPPIAAHLYRHKHDRAILRAGGRRAVPYAHQTVLRLQAGTPTAPVATCIASEERPGGASRSTHAIDAASRRCALPNGGSSADGLIVQCRLMGKDQDLIRPSTESSKPWLQGVN